MNSQHPVSPYAAGLSRLSSARLSYCCNLLRSSKFSKGHLRVFSPQKTQTTKTAAKAAKKDPKGPKTTKTRCAGGCSFERGRQAGGSVGISCSTQDWGLAAPKKTRPLRGPVWVLDGRAGYLKGKDGERRPQQKAALRPGRPGSQFGKGRVGKRASAAGLRPAVVFWRQRVLGALLHQGGLMAFPGLGLVPHTLPQLPQH